MLKSQKHESVLTIEEIYKQSGAVIVTHYHGLTVSHITALRKNLRKNNASLKVVKNTLSKIAARNTQTNAISDLLKGPTAIAYSNDPIAAAKCVVDFAKSHEQLKIIGGIVNNKILETESIYQLARLPSLDELRAKIIGLLSAPAAAIAATVAAPASRIVGVLKAYANKEIVD